MASYKLIIIQKYVYVSSLALYSYFLDYIFGKLSTINNNLLYKNCIFTLQPTSWFYQHGCPGYVFIKDTIWGEYPDNLTFADHR